MQEEESKKLNNLYFLKINTSSQLWVVKENDGCSNEYTITDIYNLKVSSKGELEIESKSISSLSSWIHNFILIDNYIMFFFFSDDKKLMLKTLKSNEVDILFEKGFFADYYSYIMEKKK